MAEPKLSIHEFPSLPGEYKVVQLEVNRNNHVLLFGPEWSAHGHILHRYLESQGIEHSTKMEGNQVAAVEYGMTYGVEGAGHATLEERTLTFYGHSIGFDSMPINRTWIPAIQTALPEYVVKHTP